MLRFVGFEIVLFMLPTHFSIYQDFVLQSPCLKLIGFKQQNCLHEIFMKILEYLTDNAKPIMQSHFNGQIYRRTEVVDICYRNDTPPEPFCELCLQIHDSVSNSIMTHFLETDVEYNVGTTELPDERKGKSQLHIAALPSVLHVLLKRYKPNGDKEHGYCEFSDVLDLTGLVCCDALPKGSCLKYRLHSVLVHVGPKFSNGHYIVYIRPDIKSDDWRCFDDETVTAVSREQAINQNFGCDSSKNRRRTSAETQTAYMLIYVLETAIDAMFPDDEQQALSEVLQHWRPQPTPSSGGNMTTRTLRGTDKPAALISHVRSTASQTLTSPVPTRSQPKQLAAFSSMIKSPVSPTSAPPSSNASGVAFKQTFKRRLSFTEDMHHSASPASSTASNQMDASSLQFTLGVQIMLREVSGPQKYIRVPHPYTKITGRNVDQVTECLRTHPQVTGNGRYIGFQLFEFKGTQFVEEDFGTKFSRIYPAHIRQIISAFNLEESNRCFFITLGIATGNDPFMLQSLFRKHAKFLQNNTTFQRYIAKIHASDHISNVLNDLLSHDHHVDCNILNFCWPSELSMFRLIYICSRRPLSSRSFHVIEFSAKPVSPETQNIFFRLHDGHFTLLTCMHQPFEPETSSVSVMLHQTYSQLRCPSVSSMQFQMYEQDSAYLFSALEGSMPSPEDFEDMWLQASTHCGLKFHPLTYSWTEMPATVDVKGTNMMGSLAPSSWKIVQRALLKTFFDTRPLITQRATRKTALSPLKKAASSNHPCVFVDAGSEAGHALFRMMDNTSITHVAGIEIQKAWFDISVEMFKHIRGCCISRKFRLPSVTLFNSCMLSDVPQITYLYSIANIVWMNNFVYHKTKFFSAEQKDRGTSHDVANAPLHFLAARDDRRYLLASNAAYALGRRFNASTCIAVHLPQYFKSAWNYHTVRELDVNPTWGNTQAAVTILMHRQQIHISCSCHLPCVTQEEENAFDDMMQKWSSALPLAYSLKFNKPLYERQLLWKEQSRPMLQRKGTGNRPIKLDNDVAPPDTRDLEALFQPPFSDDISIQELSCLQPTQVMSNAVIDEYVRLLRHELGAHVYFPQGGMIDVKYLQNFFSVFTEQQQQAECMKHFISSHGIMAFIVNTGYHWVAFKVDFAKQYIAYVCSLQNPMEREACLILKILRVFHKEACTFKCFKVPAPHQQNAVDCGPLSCMFLLFVSQNDITESTKLEYSTMPTAAAMRLRIFADIRQGRATLLVS